MNNNDHPRTPEWGWEGKLGLCHAHCGQNELFLQLPILGTQFGLPPIEWQNSLLWLLNSFWLAEWPCANHMRFLQHIKNDPTFSFYTEVVHQDDYAWLTCNPEQEHLGTFSLYGGGLWKYTSCFLLQPQMACRAGEGKTNKTESPLISEVT